MRRFTATVPGLPAAAGGLVLHVAATRRLVSLRAAAAPLSGRCARRLTAAGSAALLGADLTQTRWFRATAPARQAYGAGTPPPYYAAPQPGYQPGYPAGYQQQQQWAYDPAAAQYAAPQGYAPGAAAFVAPPEPLGTKERPLFVESAPAPRTMASRLWLLLVVVIGVSAAMNIVEQFSWHLGDGKGPGGRLGELVGSKEVRPVDLDNFNTTFADIQGCDEAKKELEEIVMFLKDPQRFHDLGGRLPRGALLVGPPGTGKTMLAKAIAKEAGVKFFYCSGSEFDEVFVGVGSRRVRELFQAAKASKEPALIFIDEIDSLGGKRSSHDQAYSRMTLNQLLAEMDGFQTADSIVVLGATNTPDTLDKALTRPGRFDTTVAVDPPDMKGREKIAAVYLDKIKRDDTVTPAEIAKGTSGFTGAEISNLINVAAIRAAVLGLGAVTHNEIEFAKDRVMMGAESRSKIIPPEELRVTAYHEGGHALTAILLETTGAEPVHKATIVPRGSGVMGLVQQVPAQDRYSQSKRQIEARLRVCLAGRIAEEMLLGGDDVTTGALSDFQQATNMARTMVRRFGFNSSLGTIDYETASAQEGAYLSDATKERIEVEVRSVVTGAYDDARRLLEANRDKLDLIAQNLLKHETLSGEQLRALLDGRPMQTRLGEPLPAADIVVPSPLDTPAPHSAAATKLPASINVTATSGAAGMGSKPQAV